MKKDKNIQPQAYEYLERVNKELYPGLIDCASAWVVEGWGIDNYTPISLATAILNEARSVDTAPLAKEQMTTVALNILNFAAQGGEWVEKPIPEGTDDE